MKWKQGIQRDESQERKEGTLQYIEHKERNVKGIVFDTRWLFIPCQSFMDAHQPHHPCNFITGLVAVWLNKTKW